MELLLATSARGSRARDVLLGLQHTAGNAAVQRIAVASAGPVVQRTWPFDDDEETVEGGGEGGSEGAAPSPTDEESDGGYGGEGGAGPSSEESSEGGEETVEGGGESTSEGSPSDEGSSSWWPFDGGESESDGEETVEGGGEEPGGGETPGEMPGEPGSEEEVSEETPEETFNRLVGEGANAAALAVVVRAYGFGGKNVASISYDPSIGDDGLTQNASGRKGLYPDEPQRITIGSSAISGGYLYCASTIGHEMQHVQQRTQAVPIESKALREFLAYSWQVIENRNLLSKKYLRANALQAYLAYQAMTEDDQFMQQARYADVQTLRQQLGPATPEEG
jgi:hypothetical protein